MAGFVGRRDAGGVVSVVIRPARPADVDALAALAEEFHEAHGDPVGFLTADAIRRDAFGSDPEFKVLLAEDAGGLLGYALYYDAYEPSYAARGVYMADLYVRPSARRTGLGRRLIAAVAADARSRGRTYVWWVAQARNTAAQSFYATLASVELPTIAYAVVNEDFAAMADSHAAGSTDNG